MNGLRFGLVLVGHMITDRVPGSHLLLQPVEVIERGRFGIVVGFHIILSLIAEELQLNLWASLTAHVVEEC